MRKGYTNKPCPGCGEKPWERPVDSVCDHCKKMLAWARKAEQREAEAAKAGLVKVMLPHAPYAFPYWSDGHNVSMRISGMDHDEEPRQVFGAAIFDLVKATAPEVNYSGEGERHVLCDPIETRCKGRDGKPMICKSNDRSTYGATYFMLPPAAIDAIEKMFRSIVEVSEFRYQEGFRDGNNVIARLAGGSLSMQELNRATIGVGEGEE